MFLKVEKCTNLPGADLTGSIDPYVEMVMRNHPVNARTKTAKGKNPVFEECYQFLVFNTASQHCELTVWDYDRFGDNDKICQVRVALEGLGLKPGEIVTVSCSSSHLFCTPAGLSLYVSGLRSRGSFWAL
jgi:Ca2+-dependent lipid-binding protein